MNEAVRKGGLVIALSLLAALILTVLPLPAGLDLLRPEWTALVLLYWAIALPERVGVGIAWLVGFLQDALLGTLLGQHALAFALIALIALRFHQQIRPVPVMQQAAVILALLVVAKVVVLWINGLIGRPAPGWEAGISVLAGTALWPVIFHAMRAVRRRFQVQ